MTLSDADKTTIREMIRTGIREVEAERRWLSPAALVGQTGGAQTEYVPTLAKAREIAEDCARTAIEAYKKDLPHWYEVHRRLDSASALVIVLFTLAGTIYQVAKHDQGGVRNLVHWVVGTDAKVKDVLAAEKKGWDTDDAFRAVTSSALRRWAEAQPAVDNPIRTFVKKTLEASPVLIFQGQTTFSLAERVNQECVEFNLQLTSVLTKPSLQASADRSALSPDHGSGTASIDPMRIPKACSNDASAALDAPLDIPFFARVYDTAADGPADNVFAILVVHREPKKSPGVIAVRTGANGGPAGLCVRYTTQNPQFRIDGERRESLDLVKAMVESGAGSDFWQVSISDAIKPHLGSRPPAFHLEQILHSVNVRPITSSADLEGEEECSGVTPVNDQVISARLLVFVNKDVDNY